MKTTNCNDPSCGNNSCDCTHAACECIDRTGLYGVVEKHSPFPSVLVANWEPNPEFLDGTEGACPAWWRGYDHGYINAVDAINLVLDALDKGDYSDSHFGGEELNKLASRLKSLYQTRN